VIYAIGMTADFRHRPIETAEAHVCLLQRLVHAGNFESLTYLSSTRVYARSTDTRESAHLRVNPNDLDDLYNLSKLMGESLCLHSGHPLVKVARLSNVIGLRRDPHVFINQLIEEGFRTGRVAFRTTLESRRDYVGIEDVVDLIVRMALSPETGIYNVASGQGISNGEIASALAEQMGFEISVVPDAPVWDFADIDVSRVKAKFAFSPRRFSDYFPAFLHSYRQSRGI